MQFGTNKNYDKCLGKWQIFWKFEETCKRSLAQATLNPCCLLPCCLLATLDAVVAAKFYLSLIQSMLHKLLCFSIVPILVVVATKYYSLSYGQLLAEWLGGCRQNFSLEFQLTRCAHFANDRYLLLLLLTMTIISISKSSTPHQYNESPAAVVATCLVA